MTRARIEQLLTSSSLDLGHHRNANKFFNESTSKFFIQYRATFGRGRKYFTVCIFYQKKFFFRQARHFGFIELTCRVLTFQWQLVFPEHLQTTPCRSLKIKIINYK